MGIFSVAARLTWLLLILLLNSYASAKDAPVLRTVSSVTDAAPYDVIIDTRPLASCRKSSLQTALCLPASNFLAPQRRLANWSGILWLLGTAGLSGHEHVLLTGEHPDQRSFVAGLLVLAGQHRVSVLDQPLSSLTENNKQNYTGTARANTRTAVYTAPMRSELIVLRSELQQLIGNNAVVLDGRTEAEYLGGAIRSVRGGHISGAQHSPVSDWSLAPLSAAAQYETVNPVSYAHDTFESLVYFATLQAAGVSSSVYLPGWVEWATTSNLPVDNVSYPLIPLKPVSQATPSSANSGAALNWNLDRVWTVTPVMAAVMAAAMVALLSAGFYAGRKFTLRSV